MGNVIVPRRQDTDPLEGPHNLFILCLSFINAGHSFCVVPVYCYGFIGPYEQLVRGLGSL